MLVLVLVQAAESNIGCTEQTFGKYDQDGDGSLGTGELQMLLQALGYEVDQEYLQQVISAAPGLLPPPAA